MKRPSHCDILLELLADKEWHSTRELLQRSGGMTVHSRVAQLRKRDHRIEMERRPGEGAAAYGYRLISSPPDMRAGAAPHPVPARTASQVTDLLEQHGFAEATDRQLSLVGA